MKITLHINGDLVTGELCDNPVVDQPAEMLPLNATFDEFHEQEKLSRLPRALDVSGVQHADEPLPGEIDNCAPSSFLMLHYANPGRWPGLVRVGRFNYSLEQLGSVPDSTHIRVTTDRPSLTL